MIPTYSQLKRYLGMLLRHSQCSVAMSTLQAKQFMIIGDGKASVGS